jgi:hypothetical protein
MLRGQDVTVTSPCPVDLDETGLRGTGRAWHCGHCSKTVHVLSEMTESDARALLAASEGQKICVSYRMSPEGQIRFKPEPAVIPVTALRRRPTAIAAAAIGVALAACAPHDNPKIDAGAPAMLHRAPTIQTQGREVVAEGEIEIPRDVQIDGGVAKVLPPPVPTPPRDVQVEGGIRPRTVPVADEPCDSPKPKAAPQELHVRGGRG